MRDLNSLMNDLETALRQGVLTPAKVVSEDTFLCFSEKTVMGIAYHQRLFSDCMPEMQEAFINRAKGATYGPLKLIAIFDVWPDAAERTEPIKITLN